MASAVFVDAGAWIAVSLTRDQYHQTAVTTYASRLRQARPLVTSNLVIAEAYELIRRNGGQPTAGRFLRLLRESGRLQKVYSDATLEGQAETFLSRSADQDFSLVDAVSFALIPATTR